MAKQQKPTKKSTKPAIDWRQTLIGGLVDLIVGTLLILITKMLD